MKKNELTREQYREKFYNLLAKTYYIPAEDEEFKQCDYPHPPYWFISNRGYLMSVYKKKIKIVKPIFDKTGAANKSGERNGKSWRYGTRYKKDATAPLNRWDMAKMMMQYFGENKFDSQEETEIHHIKKRNSFDEEEAHICNRADNLQILPKSVHKELTHYASKTQAELDAESEERAKKLGCPVYELTQAQLQVMLIDNVLNSSNTIVLITSNDDDVSQIKAAAYPVKNIIIEQE